jgi:hypothetical protein
MEIKQTTLFNFFFNAEGIGFNLGVPAETKQEACDKLQRALTQILKELETASKANVRPN